ncbi:hypothetical protein [Candidatus Pantoea floridensis]|uniref:Uncharacterized protein n=1 Tax=Candidatus Pantoea floridensis TaxID=1938870 RepID=A0A286BV23_9GAMM|nr:hypothetical protein [Pantoea floridensis]PIF13917.1 hypothetical protein BX596_4768 [Enterobacteriaceae bacterium JKS000233]SOD38016.1 hypothetical protein SAMN06273570_2401 [Pantoea floridensis]
MADPFSTILTQITNLVSFKSSIRLLIIAASIIFCWVYIQPLILPFNIQSELSTALISVIGFAIGALLSSALFFVYDYIAGSIKNKIENNKKTRERIQEEFKKAEDDFRKNEILKSSFNDYSAQAKKILLTLLKKDSTIQIDDLYSDVHKKAFLGLLENKLVIPLNRIDKSMTFCTLNPTFRETIKTLFDNKHNAEVEELISSQAEGFDKLTSKFKDDSNEDNFIFDIEHSVYINRYTYSPVIRFEEYDEHEFIDDCNIQFYIEEHYLEQLIKNLGFNLRGYILGKHNPEGVAK